MKIYRTTFTAILLVLLGAVRFSSAVGKCDHEQMIKIVQQGHLNRWTDANLKWLRDTFGADNVVSCVLHMDEKTPHLHATVVPIVMGERKRPVRERKSIGHKRGQDCRLMTSWDGHGCPYTRTHTPRRCVSSACSAVL